jgi:hypothetical protein
MCLINFFNQENSHLKNRLSEGLDKAIDKNYFNAERFQNQFIVNDEFINDIVRDIRIKIQICK